MRMPGQPKDWAPRCLAAAEPMTSRETEGPGGCREAVSGVSLGCFRGVPSPKHFLWP